MIGAQVLLLVALIAVLLILLMPPVTEPYTALEKVPVPRNDVLLLDKAVIFQVVDAYVKALNTMQKAAPKVKPLCSALQQKAQLAYENELKTRLATYDAVNKQGVLNAAKLIATDIQNYIKKVHCTEAGAVADPKKLSNELGSLSSTFNTAVAK